MLCIVVSRIRVRLLLCELIQVLQASYVCAFLRGAAIIALTLGGGADMSMLIVASVGDRVYLTRYSSQQMTSYLHFYVVCRPARQTSLLANASQIHRLIVRLMWKLSLLVICCYISSLRSRRQTCPESQYSLCTWVDDRSRARSKLRSTARAPETHNATQLETSRMPSPGVELLSCAVMGLSIDFRARPIRICSEQ